MFCIERIGESGSVFSLEISAVILDDTTFSLSSPFWDYLSEYPILFPDAAQKELLALWWRLLRKILSLPSSKHARLLFRNHLCNLFVGMEAEMLPILQRKHTEQTDTVRLYFNKFCHLVTEYCHTQHDVRFYADRLCITPHYLAKITRKMMDSSPKDLIDRQLILEIKQLLMSPKFSVKEIADWFHFASTSYLGRYFRHHTGMSPTEFRESELGRISKRW
ncbi:MAG: AraC family transcriptional regulator [Bacteroidales bacterium]|nr:AraC family transcriptional regulator [Bacteroidales bacterium]